MKAILFVVGYGVAVAVLLRWGTVLRERRWTWFVALELATAMVAAGYALIGNRVGFALNAAFVLLFALSWWRTPPR
jgi:hypothetical protein